MNSRTKLAQGTLIVMFPMLLVTSPVTATQDEPTFTPQEQLGKSIFFDRNLSINQNQACAVCHGPEAGWTGPNKAINSHGAVYEGSIPSRFGNRKPPSSAYATFSPILHYEMQNGKAVFMGGNFWDGRATGEKLGNPAADQAQGPFLNPAEQALPDSACVVYRVCNPVDPSAYPVKYQDVFEPNTCDIAWPVDVNTTCAQEGTIVNLSAGDRAKSETSYNNIADSIAAFEASPVSNAFTSKFDAYLEGKVKLTGQERHGLELFQGKAKCAGCHTLEPSPNGGKPLFTDFTFDNLGVPKNPENPVYKTNPGFIDHGLGGFLATRQDYSMYAEENDGKQKVPTLRNVDKRPSQGFVKAYMHNGVFKSLEDVVHFYNTRDVLPTCTGSSQDRLGKHCWPAPEVPTTVNKTELGNLGLNGGEEKAIVVFLKTLTDGYRPSDRENQGADNDPMD
jgi:cytochrome c peroxidase